MRNRTWADLVRLGAALVVAAGTAGAQSPPRAVEAVEAFTRATTAYATVHRRIEQRLGPLEVNAMPADIVAHVAAMAAAMREARGDAAPGDLFTPALAAHLREVIAAALHAHGLIPADLRADEFPEGIDRRLLQFRVGSAVPWAAGPVMVPCVIDALPPLPPELQYRFLLGDLLLIDVHANLVVDILPRALPATEL